MKAETARLERVGTWLREMENMRDAQVFRVLDHENVNIAINAALDSLRAILTSDADE